MVVQTCGKQPEAPAGQFYYNQFRDHFPLLLLLVMLLSIIYARVTQNKSHTTHPAALLSTSLHDQKNVSPFSVGRADQADWEVSFPETTANRCNPFKSKQLLILRFGKPVFLEGVEQTGAVSRTRKKSFRSHMYKTEKGGLIGLFLTFCKAN